MKKWTLLFILVAIFVPASLFAKGGLGRDGDRGEYYEREREAYKHWAEQEREYAKHLREQEREEAKHWREQDREYAKHLRKLEKKRLKQMRKWGRGGIAPAAVYPVYPAYPAYPPPCPDPYPDGVHGRIGGEIVF